MSRDESIAVHSVGRGSLRSGADPLRVLSLLPSPIRWRDLDDCRKRRGCGILLQISSRWESFADIVQFFLRLKGLLLTHTVRTRCQDSSVVILETPLYTASTTPEQTNPLFRHVFPKVCQSTNFAGVEPRALLDSNFQPGYLISLL